MTSAHLDGQATATVLHRAPAALFHETAGLLHQVVRFDYLALFLHDASCSAPEAAPAPPGRRSRVAPAGCSRDRFVLLCPQVDTEL